MAWEQYKQNQKERRHKRLYGRTIKLIQLADEGFTVEKKTEFHYRIDNRLDIWPIHNRYHDIINNKRGGFRELSSFVKSYLGQKNG